jgi:hypothetical protein
MDVSRIQPTYNLNEHPVSLGRPQDNMNAGQKEEKQRITSPKDYATADVFTVSFYNKRRKKYSLDLDEHKEVELQVMEWLIDETVS